MTTLIQAQHEARKARLQRFADAASKLAREVHSRADVKAFIPKGDVSVPERVPAPEEARIKVTRREYEKSDHSSAYVPMTFKILRAVADEFDMTIDVIRAQNREKEYTVPRFVAIGLMLELTQLSLPAIGRQLGGRDHTTIINGRHRINALLESEAFRNRFDQIKASITA